MEAQKEILTTDPEQIREQKVEAELKRISKYFKDMDKNQKAIISPLIQNSAFMRVTLDELQERITEEGVVEHYQNGANQFGTKQSAALQSYNVLVKNYAAVTKQLFSLLPPEKKKTAVPTWMQRQRNKPPAETEEERLERINAEIQAAADRQRRECEAERLHE